jgi:hypothetical protein
MPSTSKQPRSVIERGTRIGAGVAVSLLAWPAEDDLRRHLATVGQPRLLLVEPDAAPPEPLDLLEDWVRSSSDPADVEARAKALLGRTRSARPVEPVLDDDGLLHVGAAWVVIPPTQVPLVALLLEHLGRVVRSEALAGACVAGGGSGHPAAVRTLVARLAARVRPLGLDLVTVRQRGVLLRPGAPSAATALL